MALVADVFKVVLLDKEDNVLATDTLQDAGITADVETSDVNGGGGLLAVLHGQKNIEVSLTDPIWRFENLAMHMGQDITTDTGVAYAMPSWKEVKEDTVGVFTIELDNEPVEGTIKAYLNDGTEIGNGVMTVTGKVVEIDNATVVVAKGEKVEVRTYQYNVPTGTEAIVIDSTKFPKDCKMILETIEISEDEAPLNKLQFQFNRAKPSANFSITTSTQREASNSENTFRIMKPKDSTEIGKLLRIPFA